MKKCNIILKIFLIIAGSIGFFVCTILMIVPFFLILIFAGIDKANIIMTKVIKYPMNWMTGSNMGNELLELYEDIENESK